MDEQELQEHQVVADVAVRKTFAILGVDVNDASSVESFREDLRFGGRLRKLSERGLMAFASAVGAAMLGALVAGVASLMQHRGH